MKIADTTLLIDVLNGDELALVCLDKEKDLCTTSINEFELLRGILKRTGSEEKVVRANELLNEFKIFEFDTKAGRRAARISAELIRSGKTLGDNDCMIAGTALNWGINTIITRNIDDFNRIEGVNVESY